MKIKLFYLIINCVLSFTSISCTTYPKMLEPAFKLAGKNQGELKKVIRHYSRNSCDSLKRKSAIFLIENMDGHFSYQSKGWKNFCVALDTLFGEKISQIELTKRYKLLIDEHADSLLDFEEAPDLKVIKADYLIKNIDYAFEAWKSPFAKNLKFNQFCEYLLPYRIGTEILTDWRDEYNTNFKPAFWKKFKNKKDSIKSTDVCRVLKNYFITNTQYISIGLPDYSATLLPRLKIGTCRDRANLATFAARALGVPVSVDYTTHWGNHHMGHDWSMLMDENNKLIDFSLGDWVNVGEHLKSIPQRFLPKVFRTTYAYQKNSLAAICDKEDIPFEFISPFYIDVSSEYFNCIDVPINLEKPNTPDNTKFVYICVFNNTDWVPVHWATNTQQKAVFKGLNGGIVYLPAFFQNSEIKPAAYPLKVNKDSTFTQLKPNIRTKQTVILKRKYKDLTIDFFARRMIGGKFQVANDSTFIDAIDMYEIKDKPEICFQTIMVNQTKSYKYFRYLSPLKSFGGIAEIELYGLNNEKLQGKTIGTTNTKINFDINTVFDGKVLTWFDGVKPDNNWVGLEFEIPQTINKLVYLSRNDDNFIRDGELYELFYWDNKWISLGRQTGSIKTQSLTYTNAPTNALFLLRNLTKGREERIFTYENGKQIWW